MTLAGTECNFVTLSFRGRIFSVIPLDPFDADTIRDINGGIAVAYVGRDSADVMGFVFNVQ